MKEASKSLVENRKLRHEYDILADYEAGIELQGTEVKSIKMGNVNFKDAYAKIVKGEVWLYNMHVSLYEQGNRNNHEEERARRLLLHKHEIRRLKEKVQQDGLTLVPLRLYLKNGRVKLCLALARGRKLFDKRAAASKKEAQRDIERRLKQH